MSPTHKARQRQSARLKEFDYTQAGDYFISLVTHKRERFLGKVVGDRVVLSVYGRIAFNEWFKSARIRQEIELHDDEFVVMPNHIHGIVWIAPKDKTPDDKSTIESHLTINNLSVGVRAHDRAPLQDDHDVFHRKPKSLSSFVAGYKASVTKQINKLRESPGSPVWMRNYYDRIIRNDGELRALREYIHDNPLMWELDRENPRLVGDNHHSRPGK